MAPISENTAYQAAHRALTDVYDAPFVREGDPAVQRFGQAKVSTRAIVEWFDENMLRLHKQIADLEEPREVEASCLGIVRGGVSNSMQ